MEDHYGNIISNYNNTFFLFLIRKYLNIINYVFNYIIFFHQLLFLMSNPPHYLPQTIFLMIIVARTGF